MDTHAINERKKKLKMLKYNIFTDKDRKSYQEMMRNPKEWFARSGSFETIPMDDYGDISSITKDSFERSFESDGIDRLALDNAVANTLQVAYKCREASKRCSDRDGQKCHVGQQKHAEDYVRGYVKSGYNIYPVLRGLTQYAKETIEDPMSLDRNKEFATGLIVNSWRVVNEAENFSPYSDAISPPHNVARNNRAKFVADKYENMSPDEKECFKEVLVNRKKAKEEYIKFCSRAKNLDIRAGKEKYAIYDGGINKYADLDDYKNVEYLDEIIGELKKRAIKQAPTK